MSKNNTRPDINGLKRSEGHSVGGETFTGGDYNEEESWLIKRMDRFKRETGTRFPSFVDVLRVLKSEGYAKGGGTQEAGAAHQADDQGGSQGHDGGQG